MLGLLLGLLLAPSYIQPRANVPVMMVMPSLRAKLAVPLFDLSTSRQGGFSGSYTGSTTLNGLVTINAPVADNAVIFRAYRTATGQGLVLYNRGSGAVLTLGETGVAGNTAIGGGASDNPGLWFTLADGFSHAGGMRFSAVQTPDSLLITTSSVSNAVLLIEQADAAFDFAHVAASQPTLFIHSSAQNIAQWVGFDHDGTNGRIRTGTGALNLATSSGQIFFPAGTAALPAVAFIGDSTTGFWNSPSGTVFFTAGATTRFSFSNDTFLAKSSGIIGWSSGVPDAAAIDTRLTRPAAGVVAMGASGGTPTVASATTISATSNLFHVSGTTNITNMTVLAGNTCVTIIFDGILTFTDGNNLKLAGNYVTTADDTIQLCSDGTNWYETRRSGDI